MCSYSDRGFKSDYKEMYKHSGKPKDFRERVWKQHWYVEKNRHTGIGVVK